MERLQKKDEAAGIERIPLTDAQKAALGEVRNVYEAKLAETDVMFQGQLRATFDPAERAAIEEAYRRERDRLTSERDSKLEKTRRA
jgi:demethoxyubiquinone hydroxylase (CLK1/Coq7/Cat5 family)